jgi:hypothetical protein
MSARDRARDRVAGPYVGIANPGCLGGWLPAATANREWQRAEAASEQLQGAVEAGAALYAALRDGHSLGDEAVHDAMTRWEALSLHHPGGQ